MNSINFTEFGKRQFNPNYIGTKITITTDEFLTKINLRWNLNNNNITKILSGYADFCKLIITDNFIHVPTGTLEITNENHQYLESGYKTRNQNELPVLSRWFDLPCNVPEAKALVIVLYSKQQIEKEEKLKDSTFVFNADYGIVSVMAQMSFKEEPMTPITMMRNALGIEEGGSGVALDKTKYKYSVNFWQTHAVVK